MSKAMKCPYQHCGGEIDPLSLKYDVRVGRRGYCPKCHKIVTVSRRANNGKRVTNSQKRKLRREEKRREH